MTQRVSRISTRTVLELSIIIGLYLAELIRPSVQGTISILESALKHRWGVIASLHTWRLTFSINHFSGPQLKRIVYTASNASIFDSFDPNRPDVVDESNWNETSVAEVREKGREARPLSKYRASKVLAERGEKYSFVPVYLV